MYQALINASVLTDNGFRHDVAVLIDGDRVKDVVKRTELSPHIVRHDLGGGFLVPGFIDLQVNGGGGVLFNDTPSVDTLTQIGTAHRRFGTTRFLPTVISDSRVQRRAALDAVRSALAQNIPGVLGIHLEGPHLNETCRGVHPQRWLQQPLDAEEITLATSLENGSTLMTLAPETVTEHAIRTLRESGVVVSAGHTAASYDQLRHAFRLGVTGVTHLFNGMRPLMSRTPGAVGAALNSDTVTCSLIADGHHVHASLISLAWYRKPRGQLFLISDAMSPAAAIDAERREAFLLDGEVVRVEEGICRTTEGRLAGSPLPLAASIRYCVEEVGLPLDEVLRMTSTYPAEFLGIAQRYGRIAPGMVADFVLLDERLRVRDTWLAGNRQK